MRDFSDFERRILRIMVSLQEENKLSRQNIILKYYPALYITKEKNGNTYELFIYSDSIFEEEFTRATTQIHFLYEYLKSEYFIEDLGYSCSIIPIRDKNENGKKNIIHDYLEYFVNNDNLNNELILSETIVKLVKHNFLTETQTQFKKGQRVSWSAIIFSVILGSISVIIGILGTCHSASSQDLERIETEIHSTRLESSKLINQLINRDTINVNMIKK